MPNQDSKEKIRCSIRNGLKGNKEHKKESKKERHTYMEKTNTLPGTNKEVDKSKEARKKKI